MTNTILVVDDSSSVRTLLQDYLQEQGFRVRMASNGEEALYMAREMKPDLILLDIMMPEMDGFEFMRAYRKERETPIILLTARLEATDKVVGLELGADDYVTKPFNMRELVARIRAVLRRTEHRPPQKETLHAGNLSLDRTTRSVTVADRAVHLTPSEFDLLAILMASPGRVYTRLDLLERMQGHSFEGVARTIDVHVRNLRKKIEPSPSDPIYIETVYGVGYRFSPDPPSDREDV
ncbi:MAG: response regulator transcription factor [Anaerolineales bacterium]